MLMEGRKLKSRSCLLHSSWIHQYTSRVVVSPGVITSFEKARRRMFHVIHDASRAISSSAGVRWLT
jgi:hypothetical protein